MTKSNESSGLQTPLEHISPRWGKRQEWTGKLEKKAVHRALDIPEDDMNIDVKKGIGAGGVAAIAAAAGLGPLGLAAMMFLNQGDDKPIAPVPNVKDVVREVDLLFYDQDGNPIDLDRVPPGLIEE